MTAVHANKSNKRYARPVLLLLCVCVGVAFVARLDYAQRRAPMNAARE